MKLEIRILDDADQVLAEYKGDPCQPGQWRAQAGKTVKGKMPAQSDNQNTGTYELFGFTYQPHVQIERPNGYTAPAPGPNNGQTPPPFGYLPPRPKPSLWGPQRTPTVPHAPSANNSLQGTKIL
jgi:hypothetical protein